MLTPPKAVKESMDAAREIRAHWTSTCYAVGCKGKYEHHRAVTRGILSALRALRRQEEAGVLALAGRGSK